MIPGVGAVQISGYSLKLAIKEIEKISKTFKNANIDVSLIDLKSFKIRFFGAINRPGFAVIKSEMRLDEALDLVGGTEMQMRIIF